MAGVSCQCGSMPELDKDQNREGTHNTVWYRLECPKCGPKNAPWRRSQFVACSEWENTYYKLKPGDVKEPEKTSSA